MLVSARQIFLGTKGGAPTPIPTTLDYVQDGLVVMFDAIENAGRGVHVNGAMTEWVNLADASNSAQVTGGVTAHADYVAFAGDGYCTYPSNMPFNRIDAWTIEYVGEIPSAINSYLFSGGNFVVYSQQTSVNSVLTNMINAPYNTRRAMGAELDDVSKVVHYANSHPSGTNVGTVLMNGAQATQVGGVTFTAQRYTFGNLPTTASANANPGYRAVRVYSRALASEELASNYAIDKTRFNLT